MAKPITNKVKMGQTPVIRKDLEGGVLGEANNDGTIFIDKSVKEGTPMYYEVLGHELKHRYQMKEKPETGKPDLAYDDNSVTWKGKKYLRENGKIIDPKTGKGHPEGSMKFAWEKEADKAGKQARKQAEKQNKNNNDDMNYSKDSGLNMNMASPITKKAKGSAPIKRKKKNSNGTDPDEPSTAQSQNLNAGYIQQDFAPGQGTGLSYNYQSDFPFGREGYDDSNAQKPSSTTKSETKASADAVGDLAPGQGTGLSYDYRAGIPLGVQANSGSSDPDKPTIISKPPTMTSKTFAGFNVPSAKPMIKPIEIFNDKIEIDQGELEETGETFNVSELSPDLPMTGVRRSSRTRFSESKPSSTVNKPKLPNTTKIKSATSNSDSNKEGQYITTAMEARDKAAASRVQEREGRRNIRQAKRALNKYNRLPEGKKPIDPRTMKSFDSAEDYAKYKVRQADFTNASGKRVPTTRDKDKDGDKGKGVDTSKVNNSATTGGGATTSGTAQANFLSGRGAGLSRSFGFNLNPKLITRIDNETTVGTPTTFKLPGYGKKKNN